MKKKTFSCLYKTFNFQLAAISKKILVSLYTNNYSYYLSVFLEKLDILKFEQLILNFCLIFCLYQLLDLIFKNKKKVLFFLMFLNGNSILSYLNFVKNNF